MLAGPAALADLADLADWRAPGGGAGARDPAALPAASGGSGQRGAPTSARAGVAGVAAMPVRVLVLVPVRLGVNVVWSGLLHACMLQLLGSARLGVEGALSSRRDACMALPVRRLWSGQRKHTHEQRATYARAREATSTDGCLSEPAGRLSDSVDSGEERRIGRPCIAGPGPGWSLEPGAGATGAGWCMDHGTMAGRRWLAGCVPPHERGKAIS